LNGSRRTGKRKTDQRSALNIAQRLIWNNYKVAMPLEALEEF